MSVPDATTPARQTGSSERCPVAVLSADIADSASITERTDPE
jgi:hypothetical protein